jgi:hypothetical protein
MRRKPVQIGKAIKLSVKNSSVFASEKEEQSHRYAREEHGKGHQGNMRRVCENTCNLAPTEHLIIFAIGVSVTTPIISKVSAICLALLLSEKPDISG